MEGSGDGKSLSGLSKSEAQGDWAQSLKRSSSGKSPHPQPLSLGRQLGTRRKEDRLTGWLGLGSDMVKDRAP